MCFFAPSHAQNMLIYIPRIEGTDLFGNRVDSSSDEEGDGGREETQSAARDEFAEAASRGRKRGASDSSDEDEDDVKEREYHEKARRVREEREKRVAVLAIPERGLEFLENEMGQDRPGIVCLERTARTAMTTAQNYIKCRSEFEDETREGNEEIAKLAKEPLCGIIYVLCERVDTFAACLLMFDATTTRVALVDSPPQTHEDWVRARAQGLVWSCIKKQMQEADEVVFPDLVHLTEQLAEQQAEQGGDDDELEGDGNIVQILADRMDVRGVNRDLQMSIAVYASGLQWCLSPRFGGGYEGYCRAFLPTWTNLTEEHDGNFDEFVPVFDLEQLVRLTLNNGVDPEEEEKEEGEEETMFILPRLENFHCESIGDDISTNHVKHAMLRVHSDVLLAFVCECKRIVENVWTSGNTERHIRTMMEGITQDSIRDGTAITDAFRRSEVAITHAIRTNSKSIDTVTCHTIQSSLSCLAMCTDISMHGGVVSDLTALCSALNTVETESITGNPERIADRKGCKMVAAEELGDYGDDDDGDSLSDDSACADESGWRDVEKKMGDCDSDDDYSPAGTNEEVITDTYDNSRLKKGRGKARREPEEDCPGRYDESSSSSSEEGEGCDEDEDSDDESEKSDGSVDSNSEDEKVVFPKKKRPVRRQAKLAAIASSDDDAGAEDTDGASSSGDENHRPPTRGATRKNQHVREEIEKAYCNAYAVIDNIPSSANRAIPKRPPRKKKTPEVVEEVVEEEVVGADDETTATQQQRRSLGCTKRVTEMTLEELHEELHQLEMMQKERYYEEPTKKRHAAPPTATSSGQTDIRSMFGGRDSKRVKT